jgi:hypothetical protein
MKLDGTMPWFDNLASVMTSDEALLAKLADDYEAEHGADVERFIAEGLPTAVVTGQLAGDGSAVPLRTGIWLLYIQSYWVGLAMREIFDHFGLARGAAELGVAEARNLGPDDVAMLVGLLEPVQLALAGSVDDQRQALDDLLRLDIQWGTLFGVAYTIGFYIPCLYPPPVGALPEHLTADADVVDISADRMLDVQYRDPIPTFLTDARRRHDSAKANAERYEAVLAGPEGSADLRDLWTKGFETAAYNWGADSLASWEQGALDAMMRWNLVFSYPIEAVANVAIAALVDGDPDEIRRALEAAALVIAIWMATAVGIGDPKGTRPVNEGASHFIVT